MMLRKSMPIFRTALLVASLLTGPVGACLLDAQTSADRTRGGAALLPSDVSFVVRIEAAALSGSPLLPRLLEHPEATNPLARALGRPATLERITTVYVGFPAGFTPESRELPVLVLGSFGAQEMLADLASARGLERQQRNGRTFLMADGALGTTYATVLGDGILALGDEGSVARMVEVWEGKRESSASALGKALGAGGGSRDIVGVGRVPVALRGWLQAAGGSLAAPFATIDRLSFEGSLDRTVELRLSLHPATAEGKQGIEQALGALRVFGPSRFADDPEVLSAIQSLRVSAGSDSVDVSLTLPRSLLLRML
jgi:hypothetical protein